MDSLKDDQCGVCCIDFWSWFFQPCGLCQETRTLIINRVSKGVWMGPAQMHLPVQYAGAPPMQSPPEYIGSAPAPIPPQYDEPVLMYARETYGHPKGSDSYAGPTV